MTFTIFPVKYSQDNSFIYQAITSTVFSHSRSDMKYQYFLQCFVVKRNTGNAILPNMIQGKRMKSTHHQLKVIHNSFPITFKTWSKTKIQTTIKQLKSFKYGLFVCQKVNKTYELKLISGNEEMSFDIWNVWG